MQDKFVCNKCGNEYTTKNGLNKHTKEKHNPWKLAGKIGGVIVMILTILALFFPGYFFMIRDKIPLIGDGSPEISTTINYVYRINQEKPITITKNNYQNVIKQLQDKQLIPPDFIAGFTLKSFTNLNSNSCFLIFTLFDYEEGTHNMCFLVPEENKSCDNCIEASVCIRNSGDRNAESIKSFFCFNDDYYVETMGNKCQILEEPLLLFQNETKSKPFVIKNIQNTFNFELTNLLKSYESYHLTWGINNKITKNFETGTIVINNCKVEY